MASREKIDIKGNHADRTSVGIAIILMSVLTMAFADAVVKLVSVDVTLWQVFVARALVVIPVMAVVAWMAKASLRPMAPLWVLVRSGLLVLCWLSFYASLPLLDLSVAAVAVYTNPIMIVLLSALLTGDRVAGRQWLGVFVGFLGVVAILRPGGEAFSWSVLLPLLAAALYALSMVLTRNKCRDETPITLSLALQGTFLLAGLLATLLLALLNLGEESVAVFPFVLGGWAPMGLREWGLMALLGVLSAAYFAGVARAYQIAPPPVIATFDYGYLVSAVLWGFLFFAETPDLFTVMGMLLITAAGLLVALPRDKSR
ncbi:MAG: DMT family transporter [Pseudomonadota bacterium]